MTLNTITDVICLELLAELIASIRQSLLPVLSLVLSLYAEFSTFLVNYGYYDGCRWRCCKGRIKFHRNFIWNWLQLTQHRMSAFNLHFDNDVVTSVGPCGAGSGGQYRLRPPRPLPPKKKAIETRVRWEYKWVNNRDANEMLSAILHQMGYGITIAVPLLNTASRYS